MARRRSLVLIKSTDGQLEPLGSLREVCEAVSHHNLAPDGSGQFGFGERMGVGLLFGPGMILELPLGEEPSSNRGQGPEISQILVSMTDEDFAFPVLMRMCKELGWRMMDPETGRTFG